MKVQQKNQLDLKYESSIRAFEEVSSIGQEKWDGKDQPGLPLV